ncbi:hypothetical protein [Candidatus Liberibacter solanacearum]|nr:hypothetical protein [Candidatus Liberibacter solanacearum]
MAQVSVFLRQFLSPIFKFLGGSADYGVDNRTISDLATYLYAKV